MCGRATLTQSIAVLEKRYEASFNQADLSAKNPLPNYNIAPTYWHPVLTNEAPDTLQFFQWGLIPHWAKDHKIGSKLINARSETILEKPAFRAIHKRRCIIPFDGFYEWKRQSKQKIPYRIIIPKTNIFSVAGIWETWKAPAGSTISTFTVLTQAPNELMKPIHNRMPAILSPEQERIWLDMTLSSKEVLKLIAPYPSELMHAYRISDKVNKVRVNDATLLNEVADFEQGTLF